MFAVGVTFAGIVAIVILLAACCQVAFGVVGRVVVEVGGSKDDPGCRSRDAACHAQLRTIHSIPGRAENGDLLVVMDEVEDKRRAAVEMRRALGDLTVSKDIVVTTHDEIARRGNVVGSVLRAALREGKIVHERL